MKRTSLLEIMRARPGSSLAAFRAGTQSLRVGVVVLDNFTLNALSGFVDALRLAADTGGRSRQIECGWVIMGKGAVRASCGLSVTPDTRPVDPRRFDYVAVAGGNDYPARVQPAWLTDYLWQADRAAVPLIGLCTGTFNIARAGLMDGRTACVHWNVHDYFAEQFPKVDAVSDRIFLDVGDRITCAGSTGSQDLALHLIGRHCGAEKVQQSLRHMVLTDRRDAASPQAQFASETRDLRDAVVRRCVHLMEQRLNARFSTQDLADAVGLGPRQLSRRFRDSLGVTPAGYLRALRVRYGAWRLVHSTESVSTIAAEVGFVDASHFTREFAKRHGVTPSAYRKCPSPADPRALS
ncbi:GlxA family transcriptional regulator [Rhodobacteraceae bacterium CCMM004]|nr:GlxA family transcriptional regulator [Rhodobacteraceae bacterium CCMM004]